MAYFLKKWIVFQLMDQLKRCNGLMLLNQHDLYFLSHDFDVQFIPFILENLKEITKYS